MPLQPAPSLPHQKTAATRAAIPCFPGVPTDPLAAHASHHQDLSSEIDWDATELQGLSASARDFLERLLQVCVCVDAQRPS